MLNSRKIAFASAAIAAIGFAGVAFNSAQATQGSGFTPSPLVTGHYGALDVKAVKDGKWDLFLRTKDRTIMGVDRLTAIPGGFSGWHSHAGPTFVMVTAGEITWYDREDCSSRVYRAGESFVEKAQRAHMVVNNGSVNAEFVAVQMRPEGTQGRVDETAPVNCSI